MNQNIITKLRNVLTELCPESDDIRLFIFDAGIDLARIDLRSRVPIIWQFVLEEAWNKGKLDYLLEVLNKEFGENEEFRRIYQEYLEAHGEFELVPFDDSNPEARCPCILLLDVSNSMSGASIRELNKGLATFEKELQADDLTAMRVEVAIVSFGNGVKVEQEFVSAHQFTARPLQASGGTPMGEAIHRALDMLRQRKDVYKQYGVPFYRPWVFLITDGEPTDEWLSAAQRVQQEEADKAVAFFAVGVQKANMHTLAQIAVHKPLRLNGLNFRDMFVWLSRSLTSVSHSQVGAQVPLQPTSAWGMEN